jgi:mRNA interferase MazF
MRMPTVTYERWQVVRVPFPFTDRTASKNRPALVLSDATTFNTPAGHVVLAMITSADNAPWPLDCTLVDLASAGLPAPSVVRGKLFTLDSRLIRGCLGQLAAPDVVRVQQSLARLWGQKDD